MKLTIARVTKSLQVLTKIAVLVVSAPATLFIVAAAYQELPATYLLIVKVAALVLVEGAFLVPWLLLEYRNSMDLAEKQFFTASAWIMYVALVVAGLLHGEGLAALLLRLSIALLLLGTTYPTVARATKQLQEGLATGEVESRKVRKHKQKKQEELQLAKIDADTLLAIKQLQQATTARSKALEGLEQQVATKAKVDTAIAVGVELDQEARIAAIKQHGSTYKVACPVCGKEFSNQNLTSLKRAMGAHSREHKPTSIEAKLVANGHGVAKELSPADRV